MSVTATVKTNVPGVVAVPVITPPLDSASPFGSSPDSTVQAYGAVPPVAVNVCGEYFTSTPPFGSEAVTIDNGETIFITRVRVAVCGVELSVTPAVKVN